MTPDVRVTRGATYGFLVRCEVCANIAHREAEIDADVVAGRHREMHQRQLRSTEQREAQLDLDRALRRVS